MDGLTVWRHPRPRGVTGLCIGRTDVAVDRRKTKRLAHRIRAWARRHGRPRIVVTSPLQRTASVGRWLRSWGWVHRIDARLIEFDFGAWEGRAWDRIGAAAIDEWTRDFAQHLPGGGESVAALLERCASFIADAGQARACAVGHAGWISAARWLQSSNGAPPVADRWPAAVGYDQQVRLQAPGTMTGSVAAARTA